MERDVLTTVRPRRSVNHVPLIREARSEATPPLVVVGKDLDVERVIGARDRLQ
jgi:hypothetical protein